MSYLSSHTGKQIDDAVDAMQSFLNNPWAQIPGTAMPLFSLLGQHLLDQTTGEPVAMDPVSFLQRMDLGVFKSDLGAAVMRNIPMLWHMYADEEEGMRSMQLHYAGSSHIFQSSQYVETHYYSTLTQVDFDGKHAVVCFGIRYSSAIPDKYLISGGYVADDPDYAETLRAAIVAGAADGYTPEWFLARPEA